MLRTLVNNKILISILVLILGAAGYYVFFAGTRDATSIDPETQRLGTEVHESLQVYSQMSLDKDLLSSAAFVSLEDFTPVTSADTAGRVDPFAPAN